MTVDEEEIGKYLGVVKCSYGRACAGSGVYFHKV